MSEYGMLENIRSHSIMVARIAELIVRGLKKSGLSVSMDLTVAAALLHDIGKTSCLNTTEDHSRKGADICNTHRLLEVADIVAEHVVLRNGVPMPVCTEKEIVYYSDKRVNNDTIVSLDDRLGYILDRYGRDNPGLRKAIRKNFKHCHLIESVLFQSLEFQPGDIAHLVDENPSCFSANLT